MDIKTQAGNPVMFLVFISAILTTILWIISLFKINDAQSGYTFTIAIILLFTVLFEIFAESVAEGSCKTQADTLRASRKDIKANKIPNASQKDKLNTPTGKPVGF